MRRALSCLLLLVPMAAPCADLALAGHTIVLDPGHGVINFFGRIINPGRENNSGLKEHKLNMEIVVKLGGLLEKEGARILYTRTPADYWRESYSTVEDNTARALFANELKAEAYVSIHCDWDSKRRTNGVTTLYAKEISQK